MAHRPFLLSIFLFFFCAFYIASHVGAPVKNSDTKNASVKKQAKALSVAAVKKKAVADESPKEPLRSKGKQKNVAKPLKKQLLKKEKVAARDTLKSPKKGQAKNEKPAPLRKGSKKANVKVQAKPVTKKEVLSHTTAKKNHPDVQATRIQKHESLKKKSKCSNDLTMNTARVVNGVPVTNNKEFPFVVDLSNSDVDISSTRFCTGTLINSSVVLTAAHCVLNDEYRSSVYATVGRIELDDGHMENKPAATFRTMGSISHPDYGGIGSPNDVAVLLLNSSSDAPTVNLSTSTPAVNTKTWVVGYGIQKIGTLEEAGRPVEILSGRLQKTELNIQERDWCNGPSGNFQTAEGLLCTAGVKAGSSACRGDSGGGLLQKTRNKVVQVGITSYGDSQCASQEAGVFTDVAHVLPWIRSATDQLLQVLTPVMRFDMGANSEIVHADHITEHMAHVVRSHHDGHGHHHASDAKFYKIRTNFPNVRRVKVSLCGGPTGYKARLSVKKESDHSVVYDTGSCPDGKLSQLTVKSKKDELLIGVSGNGTMPFRLSISSKGM